MRIDTNTRLYAVLGDPVSHSLSPVMHNSAFARIGYNGIYTAFRVQNIAGAVHGIKALGIQGASITIPHKTAVMAYLDKVDEEARKIGAVNTVVNRQGRLSGYNTDGLGAIKALSEKTSIKDKKIGIMGAGGAARAIGFGVMSQGGIAIIFNRSKDSGKRLADDLGTEYRPLSEIKKARCNILINTTPVGMFPAVDATPVEKEVFEKDMIVMDIVYNPLKTLLLKEAEAMGCSTVDGVSMFVYQGAFQFELWTGKAAPVEVMKNAVLDALGVQSSKFKVQS